MNSVNGLLKERINRERTSKVLPTSNGPLAVKHVTVSHVQANGESLRIIPGSTYFEESLDNVTHEVTWMKATTIRADAGFFTPAKTMSFVLVAMALLDCWSDLLSTSPSPTSSPSTQGYFDRHDDAT